MKKREEKIKLKAKIVRLQIILLVSAFWVVGLIYTLMCLQLNPKQVRWIINCYIWEVIILGFIFFIVIPLILLRPISAFLRRYYQGEKFSPEESSLIQGLALNYPIKVTIYMLIVISFIGYPIGAVQMRTFAQLPWMECILILIQGIIMGLFVCLFAYFILERIMQPVIEICSALVSAPTGERKIPLVNKMFLSCLGLSIATFLLLEAMIYSKASLIMEEQLAARASYQIKNMVKEIDHKDDLNIDFLNGLIQKMKFGTSGYIFITDEKGDILTHHPEGYKRLTQEKLPENIHRSILQGKEGNFVQRVSEVRDFSYIPYAKKDWRIVSVVFPREFPSKLSAMLLYSLIICVEVNIIVFFLSRFIAQSISSPLNEVAIVANRIAMGDLTQRIGIRTNDEIGMLTISFNQMTAELKSSRQKIETYSKTLEQKVEERTKELKTAQSQLIQSAKMSAIGQLGAGVAHELNNPLGGILGYAQFILVKLRKPEFGIDDFKACSRYIEHIERESIRCKRIVENLLKFSRKPILAKPQPLEIGHVIEETLSIVEHQLKFENIKVTTDLKPDLGKVMGIVNQFQQVFANLILNAQQAMTEGGELKITAENIIDEKLQRPTQIKIEFTDTGCGIPEENLQKIFEPFFTTKQNQKGTGLGLSVSYEILQEYKGSISVHSQIGKGTTFVIILPAIK